MQRCVFPWEVAAGVVSGTVRVSTAAAVVQGANRFSLSVLQQVVVHVCVFLWGGILDSGLQIAIQVLHDFCHVFLPCVSQHAG